MSVILVSTHHKPEVWLPPIEAQIPGLEIAVYPDIGDPADVEIALVHRPPPGLLKTFPNLKAVIGMFAGVEAIVSDPDLPDVPIARMVDPMLARDIGHYVVLHTLRHYRQMPLIEANQRAHTWQYVPPPPTAFVVGVMGIGAIGGLAARMLRDLGFTVWGWGRSPRAIDGIRTFHGAAGRDAFLAGSNVLAAILPLTAETDGILDRTTLGRLPRGAYLINAGRGKHVVDADLLALLESGHLTGAALDVFNPEPPPPDSPYWSHPRVTITPHNAGDSRPDSVAPTIAENIRRVRAGQPMLNLVDRTRGY